MKSTIGITCFQILVIFKTPPYRDTNISERAHVSIHLYRTTDGEYSAPVDFVYLPVDDGMTFTV